MAEMIMNAEQFLKKHEPEALTKIAKALGYKPAWNRFGYPCISSGAFDPRTNAEQWIECLMWYRHRVTHRDLEISVEDALFLLYATESREALLIAILKLIGDEGEY